MDEISNQTGPETNGKFTRGCHDNLHQKHGCGYQYTDDRVLTLAGKVWKHHLIEEEEIATSQ